MIRRIAGLLSIFTILAVSSCTTQGAVETEQQDIDAVIRLAAQRTLELLPEGDAKTLAVYYFTSDEGIHESSDYIIQGLTTELANAGAGRVKIVSRQAVDRLIEEYKYQLSELVDKDLQVDLGKQLGADLILTGFVSEGDTGYGINIQLIETETGLVLGGYRDTYADPGLSHPSRQSTTAVGKRQYPELVGGSTSTTIYEDYQGGLSTLKMDRFEENYGDRVLSANGGIALEADETGNDYAVYSFGAEFDHTDFLDDWEDSDAYFYFSVDAEEGIADFDGISLSVRPIGFSQIIVSLKQPEKGDYLYYTVPVIIEDGLWTDLKLPFSVFIPDSDSPPLDPNKPVRVEVSVGFWENIQHGYFEGTSISGELHVDNVGYFTFNEPDPPGLVANFDDEVTRVPFYGELYGARFFVDYTKSDAGVYTENRGISGTGLIFRKADDGPRGSYFDVTGYLRKGGDDLDSFATTPVALYVRGNTEIDMTGFSSIAFLAKSSILDYGTFEIYDEENDDYYSVDFSLTPNWGRYRFSFDQLTGERGTLAERRKATKKVTVYFWFDVSERALSDAAARGELIVDFALDELFLLED